MEHSTLINTLIELEWPEAKFFNTTIYNIPKFESNVATTLKAEEFMIIKPTIAQIINELKARIQHVTDCSKLREDQREILITHRGEPLKSEKGGWLSVYSVTVVEKNANWKFSFRS